jgi:hypothetical protein
VRWSKFIGVVLLLLLASCAKHESLESAYTPITTFSGRLLVISPKHRFQVEIDWQADEKQGQLRLTHAVSGRVVNVQWQGKKMFWHDNAQMLNWQPLSQQALKDMGVILPPWMLAKIFLGKYPSTMQSKDNQVWKGTWAGNTMKIKWSNAYHRLELTDYKHGQRAVVIINE